MSVGGDGGMGNYPQQGYPPPGYFQPYGVPVRLRANAVASVLAGLLAPLTAGLLVVFSPLLRGESFSAQLDFVFGFRKVTGVAIGLTTIAGVLTAIVAAVAKRP